jgi:hypothetical protein
LTGKVYLRELFTAIGAYTVLLTASIIILRLIPTGFWRYVITLLPMIPLFWLLGAITRQMARLDELERKIQFEALGFAFAGTAMLTFSYGFLQNAGLPALSWFFVWPLMAILWIIGLFLSVRKYR